MFGILLRKLPLHYYSFCLCLLSLRASIPAVQFDPWSLFVTVRNLFILKTRFIASPALCLRWFLGSILLRHSWMRTIKFRYQNYVRNRPHSYAYSLYVTGKAGALSCSRQYCGPLLHCIPDITH